jgi:ABC-type amino acid transport substrate-binding protein
MVRKIVCICLSFLSLMGCGEKKDQVAQQPLIVITSPDSPPFEFKDTAQGGDQVIGFDMDVIHKIGEHLGRPVKIIEADFAALIPSLQSGRADMAIAYLSATEERRKSVDFSDPYYTCKLDLLVPEDSQITTAKDLKDKKVGVQLGSVSERAAWKWTRDGVMPLNKIGDLVQELKNGRLDAVLAEDIVIKKIASLTPGIKIISLGVSGDPFAIAFPKGSPLVEPVNAALKAIKGDIDHSAEKWMTQ